MGRPVIDLTGKKFGLLTVISLCDYDHYKNKGQIEKVWHCRCDCGSEIDVVGNILKNGGKKSCGCLRKQKDITGQTFGDLTVMSMYKKDKRTRCICKCSCGNECDIDYYNIINGKNTHCGCKRTNQRPNRIKDLTGIRVGKLTVIKLDPEMHITSGGNRIYKWICQCDCGNITSVSGLALKEGKTKSCGCLQAKRMKKSYEEYKKIYQPVYDNATGKFKDLKGQRFGKLVAKSRVENSNAQRARWLCQCDCGCETIVQTSNLTNGHTQSCGCIDSVGEMKISKILQKYNVEYKKEYTFKDCRDKHPLPFDFGILKDDELLCLIEYDGSQHFSVSRFNGMTWERAKSSYETGLLHDEMKNNYCKKNNIPILRIKYTQINEIEALIIQFLKDLNILVSDKCA